jgi:hypothetical protein
MLEGYARVGPNRFEPVLSGRDGVRTKDVVVQPSRKIVSHLFVSFVSLQQIKKIKNKN